MQVIHRSRRLSWLLKRKCRFRAIAVEEEGNTLRRNSSRMVVANGMEDSRVLFPSLYQRDTDKRDMLDFIFTSYDIKET